MEFDKNGKDTKTSLQLENIIRKLVHTCDNDTSKNERTDSSFSSYDDSEELPFEDVTPNNRRRKSVNLSLLRKKTNFFEKQFDRSEVKRSFRKAKHQIVIIEDDYIENEVVFIPHDVYSLTIAANLT